MTDTLLVTGAGGYLGRAVINSLLERKTGPIIATTRDPSKLDDLAAKGVDVRAADFDKPETLASAFAGADRMLLVSTDAVFVPGQRLAQQKNAVAAAASAGVTHVIYTSFVSPKPAPDNIIQNDHFWTEQAIAATPMSWTFMRHAMYSESLFMSLAGALASGTWATASGNQPRNYVTRDDCALADAAVLASEDVSRKIDEITGPAALSASEVANLVSELTGKPLTHVGVPADALRKGLEAAGMPPTIVGAIVGEDLAASQGFHNVVTPFFQELTGRQPTSLGDFLAASRSLLATEA